MYKIIGVKYLREHIPQIAKQAQKGQSFIVMRHQKVIFRLEPPQGTLEGKDEQVGKKLLEVLKGLQFSNPKGTKKAIHRYKKTSD